MHTLNITLKQHTPLIHFQHDQDGATLRATEVKPKLDRYLIKKYSLTEKETRNGHEVIIPKKGYENWFSNTEKLSLDYKIRIASPKVPATAVQIKLVTEDETGLVFNDNIILTAHTASEKIYFAIKESVTAFFIRNNFGKRQSKGLGGFTLMETSKEQFLTELKKLGTDVYEYRNGLTTGQDFYQIITRQWRTLKSGTQIGRYVKSKLFKYMSGKGYRWEKRLIKVSIIDRPADFPYNLQNTSGYEPLDNSFDDEELSDGEGYFGWDDNTEIDFGYYFIRAFLGLPELFEFRTDQRNVVYQILIKAKDGAERFKSPVTFKVFDKNIYAIVEEIPTGLYSSCFDFDIVIKNGEHRSPPVNLIENIYIPDEFDLKDFLRNYFGSVGFQLLTAR
jgi:hypothetical protein